MLLGILDVVNVFAAVTEGKAGETLTGEYAVIINTDTSDSRSTGTLIFVDSGSTASVSCGSELPAAQSLAGLNAGSTRSVTAAKTFTTSSIPRSRRQIPTHRPMDFLFFIHSSCKKFPFLQFTIFTVCTLCFFLHFSD